jgi:hypothetical protein
MHSLLQHFLFLDGSRRELLAQGLPLLPSYDRDQLLLEVGQVLAATVAREAPVAAP